MLMAMITANTWLNYYNPLIIERIVNIIYEVRLLSRKGGKMVNSKITL